MRKTSRSYNSTLRKIGKKRQAAMDAGTLVAKCRKPLAKAGKVGKMHRSRHAAWSQAVRERDGHTCQHCGRPSTCAHHLYPRSTHGDLRFTLANGVALCDLCHVPIAHRNLIKFRCWWASLSPEFKALAGIVGEKKAVEA